jgi:hypothetical protein
MQTLQLHGSSAADKSRSIILVRLVTVRIISTDSITRSPKVTDERLLLNIHTYAMRVLHGLLPVERTHVPETALHSSSGKIMHTVGFVRSSYIGQGLVPSNGPRGGGLEYFHRSPCES